MKVHFIAIGGAVMHNLALALRKKGYNVSGSDDEIYEPSKTNLQNAGLLPPAMGWFPEKITPELDAIILGMHARADNPELKKAQELGLHIYSYPEYLYEQSKNKTRVVIGGSHGKTTITSMVMHVLRAAGMDFDYMVGAKLEGFDLMVKLTADTPVMIFEGDEYLSSPIERRPKFHFYAPHIALISGIAWDHVNVFPTYDGYVEQFRIFTQKIEPNGSLIYNTDDAEVKAIGEAAPEMVQAMPYQTPDHAIKNNQTYWQLPDREVALQIFGQHNLQNAAGALAVCRQLGVSEATFFEAIATFKGAARRLELLAESDATVVYKDFAHSPSKLQATIRALKEQYPERQLVACMELHTFSSLNKDFMPEYAGTMNDADLAIVYYNHHTLAMKRLPDVSPQDVKTAFENNTLTVITEKSTLESTLKAQSWKNKNLLLMSSGNFDGLNLKELASFVTY